MDATLAKGLAVLDWLARQQRACRVVEVARALGITRSNAHRTLQTLVECGWATQESSGGAYRAGWRVFELGSLVMQRMNLWDEALPYLEELVQRTGETGHLAVMEAGEAVYVERVEARRALRVPSAIGRGYPAHATNLGKVLLAFRPTDEVDGIIAEKGLPGFTSHTITDAVRLHEDLAAIRERGFSVDNEEYDEGLRCIGAPVWDHTGHVVAAIGIGGPVTRVTPDRIDELSLLVMDAAKSLSHRLGANRLPSPATTAPVRVRVAGSPARPTIP